MGQDQNQMQSLEWGLRHAGYLLLKVTRQHLAARGLTMPRFWVLAHVDKRPGITMGELKHSMHLAGSSVSGLVDQLIGDGLLQRTRDDVDRRMVRLDLTDAGKRQVEETLEFRYAQIAAATEALSKQEVQTAVDVLERLVHAFRTELKEPQNE